MAKLLSEGWKKSADHIAKTYVLNDFKSALAFVNQVGVLAEAMNHHPDILIHGYKNVTLTLTTHSAKGLTQLDFDLADRIEAAFKNFH